MHKSCASRRIENFWTYHMLHVTSRSARFCHRMWTVCRNKESDIIWHHSRKMHRSAGYEHSAFVARGGRVDTGQGMPRASGQHPAAISLRHTVLFGLALYRRARKPWKMKRGQSEFETLLWLWMSQDNLESLCILKEREKTCCGCLRASLCKRIENRTAFDICSIQMTFRKGKGCVNADPFAKRFLMRAQGVGAWERSVNLEICGFLWEQTSGRCHHVHVT